MLEDAAGIRRVVIACGKVDLRKGIDGLAMIIGDKYKQNPFEKGTLFLFCGQRSDRMKGLLWQGTGFLLLYKRFESGGLSWPRNSQEAAELTEELLELPDPPTCILYPNDFSALGGLGKIYERKLSVPEDISIAGYDGIPLSKALMPPLTTLEQPSAEMGEAMAKQLISLIEEPESTGIIQRRIKGKVYQGGSVKKL